MCLPSSQGCFRMNEKTLLYPHSHAITFRSLHMLLWQHYSFSVFLSSFGQRLTQGSTPLVSLLCSLNEVSWAKQSSRCFC